MRTGRIGIHGVMYKDDRILAGMRMLHEDSRALHQDVREALRKAEEGRRKADEDRRRSDARFEEIVRHAEEDRRDFRRILPRAVRVGESLELGQTKLLDATEKGFGDVGARLDGMGRTLNGVVKAIDGMGKTLHAIEHHLRIGGDPPDPREIEPPDRGKVVSIPMVGGLHHRCTRRAG